MGPGISSMTKQGNEWLPCWVRKDFTGRQHLIWVFNSVEVLAERAWKESQEGGAAGVKAQSIKQNGVFAERPELSCTCSRACEWAGEVSQKRGAGSGWGRCQESVFTWEAWRVTKDFHVDTRTPNHGEEGWSLPRLGLEGKRLLPGWSWADGQQKVF